MSTDNAEGSRKRERDDDERSQTIYLQCKHISKPWDLLNGFLAEHMEQLGMKEYFDVAEGEGTTQRELKHDAPIEISYAFWSRKPYYLIEFRGERRVALASNLLGLSGKMFRGAPVSISLAKGTSVAAEKEKMAALGGVPKHGGKSTTGDESTQRPTAQAADRKENDKQLTPAAPARPTPTTFLPRALWKRP